MDFKFGCSNKGKPTVIFQNFEYIKDRDNACGTISWRCQYYQSMKCKARLKTAGNKIISNNQLEHNHSGNEATLLAREAVRRMKNSMVEITATPSLVQTTVMSQLNNNVLMALPKRAALSQTLRRHRVKIRARHNAQNPLPAISKSNNEIQDLQKQIKDAEFKLKTLKEERRLQMQSQCNDNVPRKENVKREESLMIIQEKIVRLERVLDETTEKILKQKQQILIPQVAQFPSGDSKFDQNLSASEIKFTQVRCFTVTPGINKGEWEVSSRTVNLSGVRCEDGKKDKDLTPNDHIIGMTLAQDNAFFTPKKTIRSEPVIKIISK